MRNITRRQLLRATALGVTGGMLWVLSRSHIQQRAPQLLEPDAIHAINVATQQLFNSINIVVPTSLVRM